METTVSYLSNPVVWIAAIVFLGACFAAGWYSQGGKVNDEDLED